MGKNKTPPRPAAPPAAPTPDDTAAKAAAAQEDTALKIRRGAYGSQSIATSPLGDTSRPPTIAPQAKGSLG